MGPRINLDHLAEDVKREVQKAEAMFPSTPPEFLTELNTAVDDVFAVVKRYVGATELEGNTGYALTYEARVRAFVGLFSLMVNLRSTLLPPEQRDKIAQEALQIMKNILAQQAPHIFGNAAPQFVVVDDDVRKDN